MFSSRFSFLNQLRIFERLSELPTMFSQSRLGFPTLDVMISTMSPFFNL